MQHSTKRPTVQSETARIIELNPPSTKQDMQASKDIIMAYDLSHVTNRLHYIDNWSIRAAKQAVQQYKNFLWLIKKYGDTHKLPPSTDIDEAWHAHILHTKDYNLFCQKVFGHYLHHQPAEFKQGKIVDGNKFAESFETNTQELYKQEFGDYIYAIRRYIWHTKLKFRLKIIFNIFN